MNYINEIYRRVETTPEIVARIKATKKENRTPVDIQIIRDLKQQQSIYPQSQYDAEIIESEHSLAQSTACGMLPKHITAFDVNKQQEWIDDLLDTMVDIGEVKDTLPALIAQVLDDDLLSEKPISEKMYGFVQGMDIIYDTHGNNPYIKGSDIWQVEVDSALRFGNEDTLKTLGYVAPPVLSLWDMTPSDTPWLIEDFIPSKGMGEIFGASQHNKTFIILDILFCIANGLGYHDKDIGHGKVAYYAGEDMENIVPRIQALEEHYGVTCDRDSFLLPATPIDLLTGTGLDGIPECKVIVFDTLSKLCGAGYDSSSESQWTSISANFNKYVKPVTDVVIWVAHTGHSNLTRSAGTKQRYSDSDFVLRVNGEIKPKLSITKMKNGGKDATLNFEMKEVKNSLVATVPVKLNKTDQAVLDALGKTNVTIDEFNEAVEEVYNESGDKSNIQIRNQRRKIKERLVTAGVLNVED